MIRYYSEDCLRRALPWAVAAALTVSAMSKLEAAPAATAPAAAEVSKEELATKTAQVRDLVASARTGAEKKAMVFTLLQAAQEEKDPAIRGMILTQAQQLASQTAASVTPAESREQAQKVLKMLDAALAEDDYKSARQFASILTALSNTARDADMSQKAAAKAREAQETETAFNQAKTLLSGYNLNKDSCL